MNAIEFLLALALVGLVVVACLYAYICDWDEEDYQYRKKKKQEEKLKKEQEKKEKRGS